MKQVRQSAPALQGMIPYDPKYMKADVLISANESPLDVPPEVKDAVLARIGALAFNRYPDPLANSLRRAIATHWGVQVQNVLCGNGGDELLYDIMVAWGGPGRKMLNFPPTFSVYETNAELTGTEVVNCPRVGDDFHIDVDKAVERLSAGDIDVVVLTSPNNPTGMTTGVDDIRRILDASDALVLVDEAYGEFAEGGCLELLGEYENLIILHTFSKAFSAAGVRLGYYLGHASVITEFMKVRQAYSVDSLSQVVGEELVAGCALLEEQTAAIVAQRPLLMEGLAALPGVDVHPSDANFVLVSVPNARELWSRLFEEHSVLVRNVSGDPLLSGCLRITVGTPEENARTLAALGQLLA